jgi:hypothetical protein
MFINMLKKAWREQNTKKYGGAYRFLWSTWLWSELVRI